MLTVNNSSWHARVYRWWYEAKYGIKFLNNTTNLCPYIRAVLIWAPLRFLFGPQWKIGQFYLSFITGPAIWFGLAKAIGYYSFEIKMGMFIVMGGAVFLSVILALIFFTEKHSPIEYIQNSSFGELLTEYARSAHDQVCPPIQFSNKASIRLTGR